jgi:predicted DsbA family dithiol-disulfide isomerase
VSETPEAIRIEVFGDYSCPFVYAAAAWLRDVEAGLDSPLDITWRWFSLEQVNSKEGPEWKVWERPDGFTSRALPAFSAGEAARRQGADAFRRFHFALLSAKHVEEKPLEDPATIDDAARGAGLDLERLHRDMADPAILDTLARDHEDGMARGVFGTPTVFFDDGQGFFLKMRPAPPAGEAAGVFQSLRGIIVGHPNIKEVKRPIQRAF